MPISGRFSYVCLRYTLPIDYLGVGFYESLVFSASIVAGLNTKVDRAFVPGTLFRSGPPSPFAWVGFESGCIFEMGCETRGGRVSALGGVIFQSLPGTGHPEGDVLRHMAIREKESETLPFQTEGLLMYRRGRSRSVRPLPRTPMHLFDAFIRSFAGYTSHIFFARRGYRPGHPPRARGDSSQPVSSAST